MIEPVVESMRYYNPLGFDILNFVLCTKLADPHVKKIKEDGITVSDKLQS